MATADNYAQLRDAVLGSQQSGSPDSPLGSFPELAQLYNSTFQLIPSNAATKAQGFQTGVTVDNQKAAAAEAKANAIDALKLKLQNVQDQADPSKYQRVAKDDGGYAFYDPGGKEISAYDYARVTGNSPADVLKDSQNPIDIGFQQDWSQLQDYINAKANAKNDPDGAGQTAKGIESVVKKNYGVDLGKMNVGDVIKRFQQAYPTVFGLHKAGVPAGQTFIPNKNALSVAAGGGGVGQ